VCGLKGGGFIISNKVVHLSLLDVCLRLRLRVSSDSINLDDVFVESKCRKLLNNEIVDVEMLYDFLRRCRESVSLGDYCRLYIVLGMLEFLIPSRKGTIFPMLFTIVDDLSGLGKYNWGGLVCEHLVGSICNASMFLQEKGKKRHFHIVGCEYLLQVICNELVWIEMCIVWNTKKCICSLM